MLYLKEWKKYLLNFLGREQNINRSWKMLKKRLMSNQRLILPMQERAFGINSKSALSSANAHQKVIIDCSENITEYYMQWLKNLWYTKKDNSDRISNLSLCRIF